MPLISHLVQLNDSFLVARVDLELVITLKVLIRPRGGCPGGKLYQNETWSIFRSQEITYRAYLICKSSSQLPFRGHACYTRLQVDGIWTVCLFSTPSIVKVTDKSPASYSTWTNEATCSEIGVVIYIHLLLMCLAQICLAGARSTQALYTPDHSPYVVLSLPTR